MQLIVIYQKMIYYGVLEGAEVMICLTISKNA